MSSSPGYAATPSSGERIVSWKKVAESVDTAHLERAADVVAPAGHRFVKALPSIGVADGVLALTDKGKVVVGGTAQFPVPQGVLDGAISDINTDSQNSSYTAVSQSGTVYAWDGGVSVSSPARACAAKTASSNGVTVAVACKNGTVEFFPMKDLPVPSYYAPPSVLSGVTDIALVDFKIGSSNLDNIGVIAVNGNGEAIRWGEGIPGYDAPPRTTGKTIAAVESRNALTTDGGIVSFATTPRHDISVDDGGLDPTTAAAGFVSIASSRAFGYGITTAGRFASWGDNGGSQITQVLRSLPAGLANEKFVAVAGNSVRVAAVVADTDAPSGPQVGTASTISGAIGGLVAPGSTLSGTPATFTGAVVTTTTDWLADGVVIASATGSLTLPVTSAMVGKDITFRTQATGGGLSAPLNSVSAPVKVAGALPHVVMTPSTIGGNPASGLTLTGTPATFDTTPDTVSTRWLVDGTEATEFRNQPTLALTDDMVGKKVTFSTRASWDADDGAAPTVSTSEPTPAIRVALAGTAVIEGDPVVGSTIKVDIDWTDDSPDVAVTGDFVYADDFSPVPGATGTSYTLTKADVGRSIGWLGAGSRYPDETVYVFTDFAGPGFGPVEAAQLTITGQPTISGSPFVGGTLTAAPAAVNDAEADVTLRWLVDGDDTGETGTSYTPKTADIGKKVTVEQVASLGGATSGIDYARAESAPTAAVTERPADLKIESQATLSGTALEGKTLTGTPATFSPTEDVTVTNHWVIDGVQGAAGGTTLALTADYVGKTVALRSIATRGDDVISSTSTAVGPVIAKLTSTAKPRIEGTPTVGQSLAGIPGGFSAGEGVTVANFWVVGGEQAPAAGALTLTEDHVGKTIEFRSVATRGDETVTATSDPVGPVVKPEPPLPQADVKVLLDGPTTPGATITVRVGKDFAGQTVSVSTTDPARQLGEQKVGDDGNIQVVVPGDIPLGNQTLTVKKGDTTLGSDGYTVSLTRSDGETGKDKITVSPDPVRAGSQAVITIGADHVGEQVRIVAFSDPTAIAFQAVAANGTVTVTIPSSLAAGVHRMAAYGANGALIGYDDFTVAAAPAVPKPGSDSSDGDGSDDSSPVGTPPVGLGPRTTGDLPNTGTGLPEYAAALGLLMVLAGFALVSVGGQRRRPIAVHRG